MYGQLPVHSRVARAAGSTGRPSAPTAASADRLRPLLSRRPPWSELVHVADTYGLHQPVAVRAHERHVGKGVSADGVFIEVHPETFKIELGSIAGHLGVHPHRRSVANPMVLRSKG